jgi:hypothetical protein
MTSILRDTPELDSSLSDSSDPLFSIYLSHSDKKDKDKAEVWKAGADSTLVFVRTDYFYRMNGS